MSIFCNQSYLQRAGLSVDFHSKQGGAHMTTETWLFRDSLEAYWLIKWNLQPFTDWTLMTFEVYSEMDVLFFLNVKCQFKCKV